VEFRRQHQLILSILKEFGFGKDIMETRISKEVSYLVQRVRSKNGEPIWPDVIVTSSVLNVIVSIVVGHRLDDAATEDLINIIHNFILDSSVAFDTDLFPILRYIPSYHRTISRTIDFNKELFKFIDKSMSSCSSDSFIQYYIDREGSALDTEQLSFIVRDLLLAGTETSATTLLWSMILLANNPQVLKKMQQEVDSVLPRDALPSLADKTRLPYVEATICEIMRIQTIVPLALPHHTTCDTYIGEFFIPANTMVTSWKF
jgi:long-chain fatty acid omega-monooxygenase